MSSIPRNPFVKFHAGGKAFAASFDRPVPVNVPVQAAVSLPTIGGHGHARVDEFEVPRLVKFKSAESHVSGGYQDNETATSQVTTVLRGLNILDIVTADRIVGRLSSEHTIGHDEGHILAIGSLYENLRIAGYEFRIKLRHELLQENETFEKLAKKVASGRKSDKNARTQDKVAMCSLVEEIETDFPGVDKKNHVVKIPHFGTIAFAELVFMPGIKMLTMMRFELGSPDGGTGVAAEVVLNGPQYPPPHK